MAVTKKSMNYGYDDSYQFLDGETVLATSNPFANNEERTDEFA